MNGQNQSNIESMAGMARMVPRAGWPRQLSGDAGGVSAGALPAYSQLDVVVVPSA
jgi:hypothetical protein